MSALAMVVRKSFNGKFTAKNWFSGRVLYVIIADADIGSLKSLHVSFDQFLENMLVQFEQKYVVWTKTKLCFLTKNG